MTFRFCCDQTDPDSILASIFGFNHLKNLNDNKILKGQLILERSKLLIQITQRI